MTENFASKSFSTDDEFNVIDRLAFDTRVTKKSQLYRDGVLDVARTQKLTKDFQNELAGKGELFKISLASNKNLSDELFYKLSRNESVDVLKAIAANPSTPFDVMVKLAKSVFTDVREALAENLSTPKSILFDLANDEDWDVKHSVAINPNFNLG
ncbi:hypothetical protein [Vibrio sp. D431a]|uniref:hypothetical protein n=1 Tax=Vibrio sp. D431a TaxID=2837388 RepID=UPI002555373B|nr:hypothetical protein [Vibrio sp. D431a]MDK9790100.1 hypothetical protein [Vibrio sp. D431a]